MSTNATSFASYTTSVALFLKGLCVSAAQAFVSMPTEGKIGALLGIGTFAVNWYYRRREDRRREAEAIALQGHGASHE
jgi:hypothetical protein